MPNFQKYSEYYDLLYRDKDYKSESQYVINKIKQFSPESRMILELGCGSGSHAQFLCEAGFKVTGVERSEEMVDAAKSKHIPGFNPLIGNISTYRLTQKFDVAISLFHVISYLNDNKSLIDCFKTTYNNLDSKGIFIFDVWYSPAVYHQKPETRIKRLENNKIEIVRLSEPEMESEKNLVAVNFEVLIKDKTSHISKTIKEKHLMRHFTIPEIKMLASTTGFEVVLVEEFLTQNPPSRDTWGVCFILKKID